MSTKNAHGLLCGLTAYRPKWLQSYATPRNFLLIFGILGTIQSTSFLYFTITLTTLERRFKIPSYATGYVLSGNEISQMLLSLFLSYVGGHSNRPKWIAWGGVTSAFSCFTLAFAHFVYGPGEEAIKLTAEYMYKNDIDSETMLNLTALPKVKSAHKLCMAAVDPVNPDNEFVYGPLILIFLSQFILGIGTTLYYTLGSTYLDDGTSKKSTPMMLAYAMTFRVCGMIFGFAITAGMMRIYIDPFSTPLIDHTDPRWLGAWWLGWYILGVALLVMSWFIGMFPKVLLKTKKHQTMQMQTIAEAEVINQHDGLEEEKPLRELPKISENDEDSVEKDSFVIALKRMLRNKLLMYNTFGGVFYLLGYSAFMTYQSKYTEVVFNKNPADSETSLISGPLMILSMCSGLIFSGYVIGKYQPPAKQVLFFNVIVGALYVCGIFSNLFLFCESGGFVTETGLINLTKPCNTECGCTGVPFSPVCDAVTETTYFSPCHAGCKTWSDTRKRYADCECTATDFVTTKNPWTPEIFRNDTDDYNEDTTETPRQRRSVLPELSLAVIPGACVAGCSIIYFINTLINCVINWMGSAARLGNILVNFRVISTRDKSFAQGVSMFLISLFALIPGPIIYGYIIDQTCMIWNNNAGIQGNCQIYDQTRFRYYINVTAMIFTSIGTFFDVLVWWYGRDMDLYTDDDEVTDVPRTQVNNSES